MCAADAGFRGGFIFPTFFAGTAFGHAIWRGMTAIPGIAHYMGAMPPILFCMTIAVGESTLPCRSQGTCVTVLCAGSVLKWLTPFLVVEKAACMC